MVYFKVGNILRTFNSKVMESITTTTYKKVINSRENLYEVVFCNVYVKQKLSSNICIHREYLQKVMTGDLYPPSEVELNYRYCFAPPKKQTLVKNLKNSNLS
jgi:hypothetical protein